MNDDHPDPSAPADPEELPSVGLDRKTAAQVTKWYRDPRAWVLLVLLGCMTAVLFEDSPIVAPAVYVVLISCIVAARTRFALRLRRRGFRVRFRGPEILAYEESAAGGDTRHLQFDYGHVSPGKLGISWPSEEAWQRRAPDWAQGRREEILARIREDLGNRLVRCVETEQVVTTQPLQTE
ncbi:MAG: hypothetical protein H7A46_10575 [Verrucomicrobiales bacterium]|nr:hypothetical protein [Verrucomicrobiales bacterium]